MTAIVNRTIRVNDVKATHIDREDLAFSCPDETEGERLRSDPEIVTPGEQSQIDHFLFLASRS
jgi:hypothetical protein